MAGEVVAGILAHSLALLSDAAHMLTDAGALALSLVVLRLVGPAGGWQPDVRAAPLRDPLRPGERRSAARSRLPDRLRRRSPAHLAADPRAAARCSSSRSRASPSTSSPPGSSRARTGSSLNIEGSFQHLLTDLFAFVATAIAGAVILATGSARADPIAALLVAALMLRAAWRLLRDSGRVLLDIAPEGLSRRGDRDGDGRASGRGRGARPARLGGDDRASRPSRRTCSSSRTPTATAIRRELEALLARPVRPRPHDAPGRARAREARPDQLS